VEQATGPAATTNAQVKPGASRMPLPLNPCVGKYTDEARAAGTEGVVVLDLILLHPRQ
jgi:hypothetical protein